MHRWWKFKVLHAIYKCCKMESFTHECLMGSKASVSSFLLLISFVHSFCSIVLSGSRASSRPQGFWHQFPIFQKFVSQDLLMIMIHFLREIKKAWKTCGCSRFLMQGSWEWVSLRTSSTKGSFKKYVDCGRVGEVIEKLTKRNRGRRVLACVYVQFKKKR